MRRALLALGALAGCSSSSGVGLITVGEGGGLPAITQLRVTATAGGGSATATYPSEEGPPLVLPKTVSVSFSRSSSGELTAGVDGLAGGVAVAHGEGSAALAASDVTMVAVTLARLSPNDGGPGDAMVADLARDLSGDLAARYLDLSTGWTAVMDGPNTPDPAVTLSTSSATQAVVSSVGGPGCGCNAQVLSIPLQATYPCQGTTLEFGYSTSAAPNAFGFNNTASLFVGFFLSGASVGSFSASEQTGHSNCALLFNDTFPSTPQIHEGQNQIALGSLTSAVDGSCNGSFDRIDVHMQGYGCAATDTSTTNLSSLRLY